MTNQKNNQQLSYSAKISFNVLFHPSLTTNEIRIYCMIEQMEHHDNNDVKACFSNRYLAETLGLSERHIIRMTSKLKRLGFIQRLKLSRYRYLWKTSTPGELIKSNVIPFKSHKKPNNSGVTFKAQKTPKPHCPSQNSGVTSGVTQKYIYINPKKETNCENQSSEPVFCDKNEKEILQHKLPNDERSDKEFLNHVKHHIDHNSDKKYHIHARRAGAIKLLRKLFLANEIFNSTGYMSDEDVHKRRIEQENARLMRENNLRKIQDAADKAYEKRIASYQTHKSHEYIPIPSNKNVTLKDRLRDFYGNKITEFENKYADSRSSA